MRTIGIRANPKEIFFAVIEQNKGENTVLVIDKLILPISLSTPDKLNFIRKTIIDIINQYQVTKAGIKITEGNAQSISIERVSIEAVIQELFSSCSVQKYFGGNISKISRLLCIGNNGDFKKIVSGEQIPIGLEFLKDNNDQEREAVLSALAALNL
ncbi:MULTISPECIES: hypothetical protein [unclassified Flavobacterium]|uniref:hypothetical protein n=1 Tax=unclassified Flavobacterium TaxID=196869 RepID=UPI00129127BC|nr:MULTISPECIES: hypothetical protein [unclassified Flavobacterium]MQP52687.1 hypothetical protein [Flavobacterium sp. LMO9]MQP62133.1 hypothetical protein [Flavobacterium sp. LMO6]